MAFGLFKKKEEEIPEDIGFETPPTLANPTGFNNTGLPPLPQTPQIPSQAPMPNQQQYTPPYAPTQPQSYNPDIENQVKLLQAKVESISVQLNTISQKLDYIINVLRSQGYKF